MKPFQPKSCLLSAVTLVTALLLLVGASLERSRAENHTLSPINPIPMDQIGAVADKQYSGDGLSVVAQNGGAQLRCLFQQMEGEVSRDGLWLKSTVPDQINDRFHVKAMAVGEMILPGRGDVSTHGSTVRLSRPGLVEEYSVSIDGVRQDFVVLERPARGQRLKLQLEVEGARVEQTATGVHLVMERSERKIAYSRLKVTDAVGKELPARIEVPSNAALCTPRSAFGMALVVDDCDAVYPVRIDPTFSDANWMGMSGLVGTDNTVYAAVVDNSGNLYIGGIFTNVGTVKANKVAKWNGNSWAALGLGVGSGYPYYVKALAFDNSGNLYVGGYFDQAGSSPAVNVAKWDGTNWSALGLGWDNRVNALTVDNAGTLYAAGAFTAGGIYGTGVAANRVAKWDGTNWSALGLGLNDEVNAVAVANSGILYAGGRFTRAGGVSAAYIAAWNGTSWSALGSGLNVYANALQVDNAGNLYAGGDFTTAGGVTANRVAKWNGINWSALGSGLDIGVDALTLDSYGRLYAAGNNSPDVFKWDGFNWRELGLGVGLDQPFVNALAADANGNVFVGGDFKVGWLSSEPIQTPAYNIVKWTGTQWSALGTGISAGAVNRVTALLLDDNGNLYAGGSFTTINGILANNIAKWNGSSWTALGAGLGPGTVDSYAYCWVEALELDGSGNLYAGGYFQHYGGSSFTYFLSKWNGSNWSEIGTELNGSVRALASDGQGSLYVGGAFTSVGGVSINCIGKWNGTNWSALGTGVSGTGYRDVSTLVLDNAGNLYAGGSFTNMGGISANRIAKWDGAVWSSLGTGMGGSSAYVDALVMDRNGNLYAGGVFSSAGGIAAANIAKWNGNQWSMLGAGINSRIVALTVDDNDNLYACGYFTQAGGISANRIAKWDGVTWSALGSGLNDLVFCAALDGANLYVGGIFIVAGGKVSPYLAKVGLDSQSPFIYLQPVSQTNTVGQTASFAVAATGTAPLSYQWRKNGTNLVNEGNISGVTTTNLAVANVQTNDAGNYSVIVTNAYGSVTSSVAMLNVVNIISPPTLAAALDNSNLVWSSSGAASWFAQTAVTHDGVDAAQSGPVGQYQSSTLTSSVVGPGALSFWWQATSSDDVSNYLNFFLNGVHTARTYGYFSEYGWQQQTVSLPAGTNVLRWTFNNNNSAASGNAGWLDQVSFVPGGIAPFGLGVNYDRVPGWRGGLATFEARATGGTAPFVYQLLRDGMVVASGTNSMVTHTNVQPADAASAFSIRVTNDFGAAVLSNLSVYLTPIAAWGDNSGGQKHTPEGLSGVNKVAAGMYHSLALLANGTVAGWGDPLPATTPIGLTNIVDIAAGDYHSLGLHANGRVVAWGDNWAGQTDVPPGLSNVIAVAGGSGFSVALRSNGTVVCWGGYDDGGGFVPISAPPSLSNVVSVAAGYGHCLALRANGTVVAWGNNAEGQTNVPPGLNNVIALAAGVYHNIALRTDGTVIGWGQPTPYGLTNTPAGLSNVVAISTRYYHNLALRADGGVVAWGDDHDGQSSVPTGVTNAVAIAAGFRHSLALVGSSRPAPTLALLQGSGGQSQIQLAGTPGTYCDLEKSPNLVNWTFVGRALVGLALTLDQLDPAWRSSPRGFFRVGVAPDQALLSTAIASQPQPVETTVGGSASFYVAATGSLPLQYQWRLNGTNLPAATNATLTLANVQLPQFGAYSVFVTGPGGSATSIDAPLYLTSGNTPLRR